MLPDCLSPEVATLSISLRPVREMEYTQDIHLSPPIRRRLEVFIDDLQLSRCPKLYDARIIRYYSNPYNRPSIHCSIALLSQAETIKSGYYPVLFEKLNMDSHQMAFDIYRFFGPGPEVGCFEFLNTYIPGEVLVNWRNFINYYFSVHWFINGLQLLPIDGGFIAFIHIITLLVCL